MLIGSALSICSVTGRSSGVPALDPTTLNWNGLWVASFGGSPWAGTASAGLSGGGGRTLAEATNPPAVGTAVSGATPADYDGVNDKLSAAFPMSSLVSDAAGTMLILAYFDATPAASSANSYYSDAGFPSDTGGLSSPIMTFTTAGVRLGTYNGTNFDAVAQACTAGAWHMVVARWDASTIEIGVDGAAFTTLARTVQCSTNGIARYAVNTNGTAFLDMKQLYAALGPFRISDAQVAGVYSYFKATYPAAALP